MSTPAPRDPFEVADEATNRALGWGVIAVLSFFLPIIGAGIGMAAVGVDAAGLLAAAFGSLAIPALVLSIRELMRRGRARRVISGGAR